MSRSRPLARRLFDVELPEARPGERYFDLTTRVLVEALAPRLRPDHRVLDLGTGLFALIGLALWRRTACQVTASDHRPEIVARARETVALNEAPIAVVESDLLDAVPGRFDFVTFNPPYVPSRLVDGGERFTGQSDGGPSGADVIQRFLQSFGRHGRGAVAYVGVNRLLVPRSEVLGLCRPVQDAVGVSQVHAPSLLPVDVYVLESRP